MANGWIKLNHLQTCWQQKQQRPWKVNIERLQAGFKPTTFLLRLPSSNLVFSYQVKVFPHDTNLNRKPWGIVLDDLSTRAVQHGRIDRRPEGRGFEMTARTKRNIEQQLDLCRLSNPERWFRRKREANFFKTTFNVSHQSVLKTTSMLTRVKNLKAKYFSLNMNQNNCCNDVNAQFTAVNVIVFGD